MDKGTENFILKTKHEALLDEDYSLWNMLISPKFGGVIFVNFLKEKAIGFEEGKLVPKDYTFNDSSLVFFIKKKCKFSI